MPDQESTTPWARETPGRIAVQYGRFARIANKMTVEHIVTKGSAVVSSQTSQAEVQSLIDRAVKLGDPKLAADIRQFASTRQYGLVFEHNRPERMRLYGKPVTARDIVQVLPRRGTAESAENRLLWRISALHDGKADLYAYVAPDYADNDGEPRTVDVADLVAVSEYDQPIYAGFRETGRVEHGGDKPYQVVINGENYHALEALAFAYAGKVDCIYIDPPYNTGAKDWKYNNDYVDATDQYRHSKWLAFMERRLKLAKRLLNPTDSVLIVTIDEKEYLRLGLLLEQMFPGERIQMISSVINPAGAGRQSDFSRTDEYIYFVQLGCSAVLPENKEEKDTPVVWDSLRRSSLANARGKHGKGACGPNQFYPIYVNDHTKKIEKIGDPIPENMPREKAPKLEGCTSVFPVRPNGREMNWGIKPDEAKVRLEHGYLRVGKYKPNEPQPYAISYLTKGIINDIESGIAKTIGYNEDGSIEAFYPEGRVKMPTTNWNKPANDSQQYGTKILNALFPGRSFPYPKSLYAVEECLRIFLMNKPTALIVDFFAGSGTTAHAVMRLNHQDGGCRRSISVTNNEVGVGEAKALIKTGLRQGDHKWEERGICEYITKPRIRAAITGLTPEGEPIKGGYKFTDEFPMADGFEENAVFYDLTYQDPTAVRLGMAFREVAPLLWLRAGARGRCIMDEKPDWDIADTYAILFDPSRANAFVSELAKAPHVGLVYVVTDDERRFASVSAMLGGLPAVRLYADYLRSFRISAEGANN